MKDKFKREIKYLRLSVTSSCNLKCIYCNFSSKELIPSENERLTLKAIENIVEESAKLGIKSVRITGGEPLLYNRLTELISKLKKQKRSVAISPTLSRCPQS